MPHDHASAEPPRRTCAAVGCSRSIGPRYLFCERHRALLPCPALKALRAACRPGTEGGSRPTWAWASAAAAAVEQLAAIEGLDGANPYRAAIGRGMWREVA